VISGASLETKFRIPIGFVLLVGVLIPLLSVLIPRFHLWQMVLKLRLCRSRLETRYFWQVKRPTYTTRALCMERIGAANVLPRKSLAQGTSLIYFTELAKEQIYGVLR
jgi:hypothetical protein